MNVLRSPRLLVLFSILILIVLSALVLPSTQYYIDKQFKGKAPIRKGGVDSLVVGALPLNNVKLPALLSDFSPQVRMGYTSGDQWEPAIASDRYGHIYILYPQYLGVPGCPECPSPTMILQTSSDGGLSFSSPRIISKPASDGYQVDAQIAVDPMDGRSVYAAWLDKGKSDIAIAKSTDFGETWTVSMADQTNAGTDKPILAVRGQDVYISYNHAQTAWVSSSHDGGQTFMEVKMNQNGKLGWSLGAGGTVTPDGSIYFSWAGYENNGGAKGPVNLYISKSSDGGASWTTSLLDVSSSPPDCSDYYCGWAYLGAQLVITSDSSGTLYALWNAGSQKRGPERMYFASSPDGGQTWSPEQDVSLAPDGTHHSFPAIAAAGTGDVRIAWMDARAATGGMGRWNVYTRASLDGGTSWSEEVDLSSYVPGYSYIYADGFSFPFGDYFEMDIDQDGLTHFVFGEGLNYDSPGSIWYVKGN